ncbi:MAG: Response regulator, CheY-like [Nitrospira sp.]|nr:response regulator [Nitrospira sp.]ULA61430.1 MAG: Response regulator, CheY-like [Nitrospira sp.]
MPLILIADDNQQICGWLRAVLEAEGYRVIQAADGREAMAAIERDAPDLMILDMYLPVQDGLETILMLQNAQSPVKILGISGQPLQGCDILKIATAFGAHGVLEKPFSREMLLQQVQTLLSSAQQPSA